MNNYAITIKKIDKFYIHDIVLCNLDTFKNTVKLLHVF